MSKRFAASAAFALTALLSGCSADGSGATAAQTQSSDSPSALLSRGIQEGTAGHDDAAKAIFDQVLAADRNNKYALFNLGVVAQENADATTAIAKYDQAIAADPKYTPAMYNKAILLERSDPKAAIALYRKILTIDAKASTTYLRLGLLLDDAADRDGALENLRAAVRLDAKLLAAVPVTYRARVKAG